MAASAALRPSLLHRLHLPSLSRFPLPTTKASGSEGKGETEMVLRRAAAECPKKVSSLVDLVNLPTALREFAGGRPQLSHLSFFLRVWSHIKNNNLQVRALCEKAKEILMEESNVQSGKEIVLKDCGEGSLAVVSKLAPKDAIMQLLTQETYSSCSARRGRIAFSSNDIREKLDESCMFLGL